MIDADEIENALHRARFLKKQAEWCVEWATTAFSSQMFRKYIDLAADYQRQAQDIERQLHHEAPPAPAVADRGMAGIC